MDYEERNDKVDVPRSTGLEGFLHAIKTILTLPNIQKIEISGKGEISYRYFTPKDQGAAPLKMSFETLEPYMIIRNSKVIEFPRPSLNAAVAICQLFAMAAADHLHPLGFVGSPNSALWSWYEQSTAIRLADQESLLGLPFWSERMLEDPTLILCAGFERDGSLIDTQRSYKLCIPQIPKVPHVG
jgi:hypothetical protein